MQNNDKNVSSINLADQIDLPYNTIDSSINEKLMNMRYCMNNVVKSKNITDNIKSNGNIDIDPTALMALLTSMQDTIDRLSNQQSITCANMNSANYAIQKNINIMNSKMTNHISYIHNCATCGHPLQIEENHPIFNCPYCGSVYIIGPTQIYSEF